MNNATINQLEFAPLKGKKITALFDEPRVSSDGGVLLLREVDRQLGLMDRLGGLITDNRRVSHVAHQIAELMRQRKEANQFGLFIHSAAYVLMHALRENLLRSSELARAQFDTIRLRLLKIGTRIEVGKTFIRFHFPASYPMQPILARSSAMLTALNTS